MEASVQARRAVRATELNLHVARFAHPSWYESTFREQPWSAALLDVHGRPCERAEPEISRWLLREIGVEGETDWELREPHKRLWLLDDKALQRLACELALAMHRQWLVRIVDGGQLRALSAEVGEGCLRFIAGELPEAGFQYQSPVVELSPTPPGALRRELIAQGARTLIALLQPAWRAVRARAQLHFARSQDLAAVPPLGSAHCERALELIGTWLIPRRFPEWAWCL
jgi:hypothetical protein